MRISRSSRPYLRRMLFLLVAFAALMPAQEVQRPAVADNSGANLPIQRIGPDDLVAIQVYDSPELTRTARVSQDGLLRLPMLKKPIKAAGVYPSDLERLLADELISEQILVRPIVSVSIAEYRSRPINVVGAVHKPLTFQAFGNVTLIDAITKAEGLTQDAGTEILVSHPARDGGEALLQRIPVKALIDASDPAFNIQLHGGEEIRVPEASKVFVVGNVKKPGAFPVHDSNDVSVLRMVALAEGLLPYSAKEAYIYRRGDASHGEISIPLSKIMDRKAPDVPLLGNDVLYVPQNNGKKVTAETLRQLATFGAGTLSGVLIWH